MPVDYLLGLLAFVIATAGTPGPNTMLLLASGVNYGVRPTLPHILGISGGIVGLILAVGLGLGAALMAAPRVALALKIAGISYMLWLAWRIATAGPVKTAEGGGRPMSFLEAAVFQFVNPKAWAMAISGVAAFTTPDDFVRQLAVMMALFAGLNVPIGLAWTGLGAGLATWLGDPRRARMFNLAMAALLVASLVPAAADLLEPITARR
jgi:threonine/homoserine/homoserine lactone efflux protein